MLPEDNVRKGFLRDEDYSRLVDEAAKVGLWLRTLLALYYNYGWRKSEAAEHLKVNQIDLGSRTILLSRYSVKNKKPKQLKMTKEVYELLAACVADKSPDDLAITREDGSPAGDFRKAWRNICDATGVPNLLVHDLRRTAVRNLRRLGFAEKTTMEISGHKSPAVFKRYDIVDEADLAR
jgi:integrase